MLRASPPSAKPGPSASACAVSATESNGLTVHMSESTKSSTEKRDRSKPMTSDRAKAIAADGALMQRLAAGDETAARDLVDRFARPLARFAAGILNDPAEGEDVAHEAIMRLWRNAESWRPEGVISAWLKRSAYTLSIDRLRKTKRMVDDPEGETVARATDNAVDPENAAFGQEVGVAVRAAMARLPERQRAAVLLAQQEGLSGQEIADALDSTPEAVESLLARARRALRQDLADVYRDARGAASGISKKPVRRATA